MDMTLLQTVKLHFNLNTFMAVQLIQVFLFGYIPSFIIIASISYEYTVTISVENLNLPVINSL